ncbi:PucR family transcriptional regulator [Plantactinospora sp. GCM10030261]|uniref:PucR family transcriptional regulator n=1 Tax=Plantactinospora sp. GCM10030261 TaxID=3273420 RepID=UPI003617EC34
MPTGSTPEGEAGGDGVDGPRAAAARPAPNAPDPSAARPAPNAPDPSAARPAPSAPDLTATLRRIERSAGALATASVTRMEETLPWFRGLPAEQRSWVMLVAQAGVRSLVEWLRKGGGAADSPQEVSDEVFAAAPRTLARTISLQQTVALIKVTIDVVEEQVPHLAATGEEQPLREAVLRFSREIAFSAARVYARAAENRGAWDARLQALLVDALLRGDSRDVLASRAAALGWADAQPVAVAVGRSPGGEVAAVLHTLYRAARRLGVEIIGGVHGDRLVVVLGGAPEPLATTERLLAGFGPGPVVVGQAVPNLDDATESARAAVAGYRAAPAWPAAPRPVAAVDLLPERALAGDSEARRSLRQDVFAVLVRAGGELLATLDAFFASGGVLESAARTLYVHPNTVRYRLRRIAEVTGYSPLTARDAYALRVALTIGRLDPVTPPVSNQT